MKYSVIYSIDVPRSESIAPYVPPKRKQWDLTEGDDQYDYGYLEGDWSKGKHRKFCALLSEPDFERFIHHCGLMMEDVETLGSLGAPGCGPGVVPAFSFNDGGSCDAAILSAYVTPIPDSGEDEHVDWDDVKAVMLERYG